MTIAERIKRSKAVDTGQKEESLAAIRRIPRDVIFVGILILASTGSFGLGMVASKEGGEGNLEESGGKVLIEKPQTQVAAPAADAETPNTTKAATKPPPAASGGQYVASKTGTKYYLPWCGTAKRINDENKVWFSSKAEAEAAGYEPAKNCKGI